MKAKVVELENTITQRKGIVINFPKTSEDGLKYNLDKDKQENTFLDTPKEKNQFLKNINLLFKRMFDIIGSLIGIILLIPLTMVIAILNLINHDNGPLFYSHMRIGKDGKLFKIYKFRTMVVDADKKLREILEKDENLRKEWEENRKLKNDPRITKIGTFLRKTSLDEFPQFICVLKGDMSLVGPRAVVIDEIDKFGIYKKDIFSVRPGMTGYWAANGRSSTTYEERVHMEYKYVVESSLLIDFKILLKTIISVLKEEGAV